MKNISPSLFVPLKTNPSDADQMHRPSISYGQDAWRRFKCNHLAMGCLAFLFLLTCLAILGPIFSGYTYYDTHLSLKNTPPSSDFYFGSDDLGRDIFTRLCYGARISLFVGCSAAFIDLIIGVIWGSIAAFSGGKIDEVMMRIADILYAIPYLLVVILLMVFMGSGIIPILIALTIVAWIDMARIVRGQILQLKEQEFVYAAQALGASFPRIVFRHLIPNALGPIIVTITLTIPSAIFVESFLSFLGLGIQAPISSWGTMASDGLPAMKYYPWRLFFPAGLISITMMAFNLIGDGLRDAFDPRLRK